MTPLPTPFNCVPRNDRLASGHASIRLVVRMRTGGALLRYGRPLANYSALVQRGTPAPGSTCSSTPCLGLDRPEPRDSALRVGGISEPSMPGMVGAADSAQHAEKRSGSV